jgi:hypothetical protein
MTISGNLSPALLTKKGLQNGLFLLEPFSDVDLWWTPDPSLRLGCRVENPCKSAKADARTRTGDPFITRERRVRDRRPFTGTRGHVLAADRPDFTHIQWTGVPARARADVPVLYPAGANALRLEPTLWASSPPLGKGFEHVPAPAGARAPCAESNRRLPDPIPPWRAALSSLRPMPARRRYSVL